VLPHSVVEVQDVVKFASDNGLKIVPRGAGTGLSGGTVPIERGIVLAFTRMNRILEIDSDNFTALVEPGVITDTLSSVVEEKQLFYPPDPASSRVSTIGGNVAENAGGLRGLKYGVTKDYVLGLEVVLANGNVITTGGKMRKNVAGYDLTALMVGSEGTLGIITKALLRLLPLPEVKKTIVAAFKQASDSTACISDILSVNHIIPATLEFLDRVTIRCVNDFLGAVLPQEAEVTLFIEVDGDKATAEEDAEKTVRICQKNNAITVNMAKDSLEADALTLARRSALPALSRVRPTTILEDVSVPPSKLAEMVNGVALIGKENNIQIGIFGHAGDGNLHPTILTDSRDTGEMERVHKTIAEIFELVVRLGGAITGEHGIGIAKRKYLPMQLDHNALEAMKAIKHAFDPQNILNPGKIFESEA